MIIKNGLIESSFEETFIGPNQHLLTVLSGSKGAGTHVSMWLEHFTGTTIDSAETMMFELTSTSKYVDIDEYKVQNVTGGFGAARVVDLVYRNRFEETPRGIKKPTHGTLQESNHRSYELNNEQRDRLRHAIQRFSNKAAAGKYVYWSPGGGLGRVFSLPGRRAVNCADFVLKVLNEAGVGNRYSLLFNTPKRLAKRRD